MSGSSNIKEDFIRQFHDQFATNYNSISTYLMTFFVALLWVFTPYYDLVNKWIVKSYMYDYESFAWKILVATVVVLLVLCIIMFLCVRQGLSTRRDQIIMYRMRRDEWTDAQYRRIFSSRYHPFNKNISSFMIGIFNQIYFICLFIGALISALSLVMIWNIYGNKAGSSHAHGCCMCDCPSCKGCVMTFPPFCYMLILIVVLGIIVYIFTRHGYRKYKKFCAEFNDINPSTAIK